MEEYAHGITYTWREIYTEGQEGHTHGGVHTHGDIQTERIYIWKGIPTVKCTVTVST